MGPLAIAVAAVGPHPPPALLDQLALGGRLVMPIGANGSQTLVRITRAGPAVRAASRESGAFPSTAHRTIR